MKKIASFLLTAFVASTLFALPMFANEEGAAQGKEPKAPKTLTAEVVTCVQTAVETRDTAIIAAVDKYTTAVKAAITARKDALKAAWALPTAKEMRPAIKAAWAAYKTSLKDARKVMKTDKKAAWDKFKADRKTCKAPNEIDNSSEGMDSQL